MRRPRVLPVAAAVALLALAAPASAQVPAPGERETWRLATIGDSYASGEGAPEEPGSYDAAGHGSFSQREDWDVSVPEFVPGPPGQPAQANQPGLDTERCHRSPASTSGVAVAYLRESFPDVEFPWTSVACSGASIVQGGDFANPDPDDLGGLLRPYKGAEDLPDFPADPQPALLPSQIAQLNARLPNQRLDALIVGAGGNDAGFGSYIVECGKLPGNSTGDRECHTNEDLDAFRRERLELLRSEGTTRGRYDRLAAALRGDALADTGDPELSGQRTPRRVLVAALPDVVRKSAIDFCDAEPEGQPEEELTFGESQWLEFSVKQRLNALMEEAADEHDWVFADSHVDDFQGHAICQPDNWINRNAQALPSQGDDVPPARDVPFVDFAQGWVHPNHAGYERIGHSLAGPLVSELKERLTPDQGPRVLVSPIANGARLRMDDSALPTLAAGYYHQYEVFRRRDDGAIQIETDAAARGLLPYGTTSVDVVRDPDRRYLVETRACAPLSRDGSAGCGPAAPTRLSLIVPQLPVDVTGGGTRDAIGRYFFTVRWRHASAVSAEDATSSRVRIRRAGSAQSQTFTVAGNVTSFSTGSLSPNSEYDVSVAACNDAVGCSAFTRAERISGAVPVRDDPPRRLLLPDPSRVDVAGRLPRCDRSPRPFTGAATGRALAPRPGLGPVVIEDENRSFSPPCILDPPVGDPSVSVPPTPRAGRAFEFTVRWRHPRSVRELDAVGIRVRSASGVLATLGYSENDRRFSFAAGRGRAVTLAGRSARLVTSKRTLELRVRARLGSSLARRPLLIEVTGSGDDGMAQAYAGEASLRPR